MLMTAGKTNIYIYINAYSMANFVLFVVLFLCVNIVLLVLFGSDVTIPLLVFRSIHNKFIRKYGNNIHLIILVRYVNLNYYPLLLCLG